MLHTVIRTGPGVSVWRFAVVAAGALLLAACGGSTGAGVEDQPNLTAQTSSGGVTLLGPPPQTEDVQRFRINLWENVAPEDRCGQCHGTGGQAPTFARNDDINLAYEAANSVVNLASPATSRLVEKVAGGHNCWLSDDLACADILTTWIANWAGEAVNRTTEITLRAPVSFDPGASKSFPADSTGFATTVYPVVTTYCAGCHSDSAAVPQSPLFASADVDAAYAAAQSKLNLDTPANSRLVLRLGAEFHNCWTDCGANAATMQAAIQAFADGIPTTEIDPLLVTSKAMTLGNGIVASGGGRYDTNAIALYQFKSGVGVTAFDTSGVEPAINLTLSGGVSWVGGWGLRFENGGRAQGSTTSSVKLQQAIAGTGEYSIEAWVAPANVTQENASFVSYSGGSTARNFALAQTLYNYDFLARTADSDQAGAPALSTPDADEILQATLQHVVATYDPTNGQRLYVNGDLVDLPPQGAGSLPDWDDTFALAVGADAGGSGAWSGVLRLVAIHNRALTPEQIVQNFDAGVGERFFLLFGVGHLIGMTDAYVVFEVSQFDSYSYLFGAPRFVTLDAAAVPRNVPLAGMRIGINGQEPEVGQAYANLDTLLDEGNGFVAGQGQDLAPVATIIGLEKGPDADEFFLTFDQLGGNTFVRVDATPAVVPTPPDMPPAPVVGLKTFDEINASMAVLTGVDRSSAAVAATFSTVRQQLPVVESVDGFLSSHQMAVTQLAIEYCNAAINEPTLRSTLFPGFNFGAAPASAFDAAGRNALLDPLLDRFIDTSLATQPDRAAARAELDALVTRLLAGGDTTTIAKGVCAAALGSAANLLQ